MDLARRITVIFRYLSLRPLAPGKRPELGELVTGTCIFGSGRIVIVKSFWQNIGTNFEGVKIDHYNIVFCRQCLYLLSVKEEDTVNLKSYSNKNEIIRNHILYN